MSKESKEKDEESTLSSKNWSYDGNEEDWNAFDRRIICKGFGALMKVINVHRRKCFHNEHSTRINNYRH